MKSFLCSLSTYQIFIQSISSVPNCNTDLWLLNVSFRTAGKLKKFPDISVFKEIIDPEELVDVLFRMKSEFSHCTVIPIWHVLSV